MAKSFKSLESIVGQRLKEMRIKKGLSQEDLSLETGLDRSYISMVERGKRNPTLIVIFRLCEILDIQPSALVKHVERDYENS